MPEIKTPSDLIGQTKDLETTSQTRLSRQDEDERLWRLERYTLEEISERAPQREKDFPSFTSNEPRTQADAFIGMLTRTPIRPRGEIIGAADPTEENEISVHERFLIGVSRLLDHQRRSRGESSLQEDVAWYMAIRGGTIVRTWLDDKPGPNPFGVTLFDPIESVWLPGASGLAFFSRHYLAPVYAIRETWGEDVKGDRDGNAEVWDGWWVDDNGDVFNMVVTADNTVLNKGGGPVNVSGKPRHLNHIPIHIIPSMGAPVRPRPGGGNEKWQQDQWESIYGANRLMFAHFNRIGSLYSLIVRQGAIGPYQARGTDLPPKLEQALKPFAVIDVGADGEIKPIAAVQLAQEAKELWAATQGAIQRGGVPYSVFGQLPFELSGVAVSQLQGALEIRTRRLAHAFEALYEMWSEEIIAQFLRVGKKVTLQGYDRRSKPFMEEFTRATLRTKFHIGWELRTDLPITRLQEATIAEQWARLGVPLIHIFDELLHLQDPGWAYRRRIAESADQDPILGAIQRADAFMELSEKAVTPEEKARFATYANILLKVALGGPAGGQQGGEEGSMPAPGVASPEMLGVNAQHDEFQPGPQNISAENRLNAMGLAGPRG